ncbi:radical SAM protein [Pelomyxa schiedti]|nr:radical SAM protein [Pelomyxa schiedti]
MTSSSDAEEHYQVILTNCGHKAALEYLSSSSGAMSLTHKLATLFLGPGGASHNPALSTLATPKGFSDSELENFILSSLCTVLAMPYPEKIGATTTAPATSPSTENATATGKTVPCSTTPTPTPTSSSSSVTTSTSTCNSVSESEETRTPPRTDLGRISGPAETKVAVDAGKDNGTPHSVVSDGKANTTTSNGSCVNEVPSASLAPPTINATIPQESSEKTNGGTDSKSSSNSTSCQASSSPYVASIKSPTVEEGVTKLKKVFDSLIEKGFAEKIPRASLSLDEIRLKYKRNPLENVNTIIFEYTSKCGFSCHHCYNSRVQRTTTSPTNVELLKRAVDAMVMIGINQFAFIGGEVTQFGDGWLDLVQYIASKATEVCGGIDVVVLSSGWFLEQTNFTAAGVCYPDVPAYLAELKRAGVTHVGFSIDGPTAAVHDANRGHPGLFDKIMRGIPIVRKAGLQARASILLNPAALRDPVFIEFLVRISDLLYTFPPYTRPEAKIQLLSRDRANILTNFIDIGAGAHNLEPNDGFDIRTVPPSVLYCKAFFRPSPYLTIKANGELALCRITTAGEGYGSIFTHPGGIVPLINTLHNSFIFQLHAQKRVQEYIKYVDTTIFGTRFRHACSLRAVITMIAQMMHDQGVQPTDTEAIRKINLKVAWLTGHSTTKPPDDW